MPYWDIMTLGNTGTKVMQSVKDRVKDETSNQTCDPREVLSSLWATVSPHVIKTTGLLCCSEHLHYLHLLTQVLRAIGHLPFEDTVLSYKLPKVRYLACFIYNSISLLRPS